MLVAKSADKENFRFRLPPGLKTRWAEMCLTKNISQQDAIEATIEFLLDQDDVTQSILLKQMKPTADLLEIVLRKVQTANGDTPRRDVSATPKRR